MAKDSPYFQFPVKMLASESDTQSLVQNICSYSLWHYGVSLWEVSPEQVETLAKEYIDCHPSLTGLDRNNSEHQIVMAAAERLNVGLSNIAKGLAESDMLAKSSVRYWIEQLWFSNFFQHCKRGQECWCSISTASDQAFAKVVHQIPTKQRVKTKIDVST